jgi:putative DNA primase/helicase
MNGNDDNISQQVEGEGERAKLATPERHTPPELPVQSSPDAQVTPEVQSVTPLPPVTVARPPLLMMDFTDVGNAERLVELHGPFIRYVPQWGTWLVWDKKRWCRDDRGKIVRLAKRTTRILLTQATNMTPTTQDDVALQEKAIKFALASRSRQRLEAMIALAKPEVVVTPDELDRDHFLLNVKNGTLDLRTGKLREHRQQDFITKLAPVDYDQQAECPTFIKFLERIIPDVELCAYLQRALGYSITGDTSEKALFIPLGPGDNGKTSLLEPTRRVLGDYAMTTPIDTLLIKADKGRPRDDITRLQGARFVTASETEEGVRLAEAAVKRLTGQDKIAARSLYERFFEYDATYKIWLACNHAPIVQGTDNAIWLRLKPLPGVELSAREYSRLVEIRATVGDKGERLEDVLHDLVTGEEFKRASTGRDGGQAELLRRQFDQYDRIALEKFLDEREELRQQVEATRTGRKERKAGEK